MSHLREHQMPDANHFIDHSRKLTQHEQNTIKDTKEMYKSEAEN